MKTTRRAAFALLATPALAQTRFSAQRPVRIIVPYTPGGVSDITARLIADPLAASWGQPVAVENRAGADGVIGTEALARAAPRAVSRRVSVSAVADVVFAFG
jgi:tripartite-type tricarboxylate transporter receptor subunit TctC